MVINRDLVARVLYKNFNEPLGPVHHRHEPPYVGFWLTKGPDTECPLFVVRTCSSCPTNEKLTSFEGMTFHKVNAQLTPELREFAWSLLKKADDQGIFELVEGQALDSYVEIQQAAALDQQTMVWSGPKSGGLDRFRIRLRVFCAPHFPDHSLWWLLHDIQPLESIRAALTEQEWREFLAQTRADRQEYWREQTCQYRLRNDAGVKERIEELTGDQYLVR